MRALLLLDGRRGGGGVEERQQALGGLVVANDGGGTTCVLLNLHVFTERADGACADDAYGDGEPVSQRLIVDTASCSFFNFFWQHLRTSSKRDCATRNAQASYLPAIEHRCRSLVAAKGFVRGALALPKVSCSC